MTKTMTTTTTVINDDDTDDNDDDDDDDNDDVTAKIERQQNYPRDRHVSNKILALLSHRYSMRNVLLSRRSAR